MDITNKALFFDMDDTIVMTDKWKYEAKRKVLQMCGIQESRMFFSWGRLSPTEFKIKIYPLQTKYTFEQLQEVHKTALTSLALANAELCPGVDLFVKYAHELKVPMFVVSGSPQWFIKLMLTSKDLYHYFKGIVSIEDVIQEKPGSICYSKAMTLSGYKSVDCIAFEDSEAGMLSARNAGLSVIGINAFPDESITRFGYKIYSDFTEVLEDCKR